MSLVTIYSTISPPLSAFQVRWKGSVPIRRNPIRQNPIRRNANPNPN